jgi:hypothetical protein
VIFRYQRGLSTLEAEDLLRSNLVRLVDDSTALEIPAAILSRVIDFQSCEARRKEYERLFTFCLEYLKVNGSSASQILRTLEVTRLSHEDLRRLCAVEQLNWSVLNESVAKRLIDLEQEFWAAQQQKKKLEKKVAEQQQEIKDLRTEVAREQREKNAIKAKKDQLVEDVGKLKEEIRQMAAQRDSLVKELAQVGCRLHKTPYSQADPWPPKPGPVKPSPPPPSIPDSPPSESRPVKASLPPAPLKSAKQFPVSVKIEEGLNVPDGIIAHLTREYGGNLHDRGIVEVTSGSFEPTPEKNHDDPKQVVDLDDDSIYWSDYRDEEEDIPNTKNNWVCYDLKERRIVPTHCTIRTCLDGPGGAHLKSWLVETSVDGGNWREVAREKGNDRLNGKLFVDTFAVTGCGECRFIRLVNIGRNHARNDCMNISAWEIFGSLIE